MSNSFEQTPNPLLSVLPPLSPDLHEEPLAPANPFLGWMSPGGGDSSALLPWVDDDLRQEDEPSTPVGLGLGLADAGGLVGEALTKGGQPVGAAFGHEVAQIFEGEASTGAIVGSAANAVLAPMSIAGGIMDMIEGFGEWSQGNKLKGGFKIGEGSAGAASGACGLAALGGVSAALPLGLALGTGATAAKVGRYGDQKAKELGWFHDDAGHALAASEWAGQLGRSVNDSLTDRGHPRLGAIAGGATLAGATIANIGIAPAAAAIGAGHSIGSSLAHHHRAKHYAQWDGINGIEGGAEALADDDDKRDAAIERSKREHPERWGPTVGQWYAKYGGVK